MRTCPCRNYVRLIENNFNEDKGAGIQLIPLQSRSTDRDDGRDSKKRRHTVDKF